MFATRGLEDALELLGQLLAERAHPFEVVAIGGGGLLLLGAISRPTRDLDLVALIESDKLVSAETIPPPLLEAIADVARVLGLPANWMNGGPSSIIRFGLPDGFRARLQRRVYDGLGLSVASRFDQIHFKLYAAADDKPHGKHHIDLQQLKPTHEELLSAARWARTHDTSEGFAQLVKSVLKSFDVEESP